MRRKFTIHETAEVEINEAADFYDLKSPGLGNVYLSVIERAIGVIAQYPE